MTETHDLVEATPQASSSLASSPPSSPPSSSSSSSDDDNDSDSSQPMSLLERFKWDEIEFETLRRCIEPVKRNPPLPQKSLEDYTEEVFQRHRQYLNRVLIENPYRIPSALRYAACCGYFLNRAQTALRNLEATDDQEDSNSKQSSHKEMLRALRQVLLFDRAQVLDPHPSDFPQSQLGNVYLGSAAVLLKYTIYTRYQHYVGRNLPSLSFPIRPLLRRIWRGAYKQLLKELEFHALWEQDAENEEVSDINKVVVHSIAYRINQLLRLQPMTIERAMESLEKYARFRHKRNCWKGSSGSEVRTYQLENLVRTGDHRRLAEILYKDFRALESLKRFEKDDMELVHLQAIINGFTEFFFQVKCSGCKKDEDISKWQPKARFRAQRSKLLRHGSLRFGEPLRWRLRVQAEKAEEKFGNAWTALCRNQGDNPKEVQKLLSGYLRSLGVEDASLEEGGMNIESEEESSASFDGAGSDEESDGGDPVQKLPTSGSSVRTQADVKSDNSS